MKLRTFANTAFAAFLMVGNVAPQISSISDVSADHRDWRIGVSMAHADVCIETDNHYCGGTTGQNPGGGSVGGLGGDELTGGGGSSGGSSESQNGGGSSGSNNSNSGSGGTTNAATQTKEACQLQVKRNQNTCTAVSRGRTVVTAGLCVGLVVPPAVLACETINAGAGVWGEWVCSDMQFDGEAYCNSLAN